MPQPGHSQVEGVGGPDWLQAEREHEDDLRERGTIPELFETSVAQNLDSPAQMYKGGIYNRSLGDVVPSPSQGEYGSITYGETCSIVRNLAAGFRELGIEDRDRVGIFGSTRMEWAQSDLALLAAGAVVTTVYTDSSPDQAEYMLDDAGATGVVVEKEELLDRVLEVEDELDLSVIVLMDEPAETYDRDDIYTLGEVHDLGEKLFAVETYQTWLDETEPDDLASLIYTSGTTGRPKGVRLTHWNFRSNVHMARRRVGPRPDQPDRLSVSPETVSISFLPLAHVLERLAGHFLMLGSGATVGYAESPDTMSDDIQKIKPHAGISVPRVYERIFDKMRSKANDGAASVATKPIFEWSVEIAKEYAETDKPEPVLRAKHAVADRLVYRSVREQMGGRIEFMVSGGGSLSADLAKLFKGMEIPILEGYGLTETSPVVSVNSPDDVRPGTLGPSAVGVDVAIDESEALEDEHEGVDGTIGELLVRGDSITDGYWRNPGATERAFTDSPQIAANGGKETAVSDGGEIWFRTGDLIEQTPDGFLIFHERLKQIFVLSTGKNVAPGSIEDRFSMNDRIEQVMVVGDDEKFVGALIVPNYERLQQWAEQNDIDLPTNRHALCNDERVLEWIEEAVAKVNEDLGRIQQVKKFALVEGEWTAENDMLTPSMKKKRRNIRSTYEEKIEEIYRENSGR